MSSRWTIECSSNEARTVGATELIGSELIARVSSSDHLPGAEGLLRYLVTASTEADLRVGEGESAAYGFAEVGFRVVDGAVLVHDAGVGRESPSLVDGAIEVFEIQRLTCKEADSEFAPPSRHALGVVSPGVREGDTLELVRYPPTDEMSGWWFLADRHDGDVSRVEGHHLCHVAEWRPEVVPYLALAPGSVVTVTADGETVAFDGTLLHGRGPAASRSGD